MSGWSWEALVVFWLVVFALGMLVGHLVAKGSGKG